MDVGGLLGALGGRGSPGPSPTLLLDSLSWLLLRMRPPHVGGAIAGLLRGGTEGGRVVALLHEDLHPPSLVRALGAMATAQLVLGGPAPMATPLSQATPPRLVRVLTRPRRGGGTQKDEAFTVHPNGTLGVPPPLLATEGEGGGPSPTPPSGGAPSPITFRLRLSGAERAARAAVTPPYEHRSSMQGVPIDPDPPEDEDPDEDLDV
ncbi:uncharacterized protein [Melopsittacus undulatus]|nr:uncharacterized protein LOC117437688 isoform X1 [Melopsittacus undulatus]